MPISQNLVHYLEYHRVLQHSIVVELAEIFDLGDSPLIVPELILLETKGHGVKDIVDDPKCKAWVISVYSTEKYRENMDAAVLNLGGPREYFRKNSYHL